MRTRRSLLRTAVAAGAGTLLATGIVGAYWQAAIRTTVAARAEKTDVDS